jgi:cyclopropane-fatty-acyl-phospholipid synthase
MSVPTTSRATRRARELSAALAALDTPCELRLPDGETISFGTAAPAFRLSIVGDRVLKRPLTEFSLARAYVEGRLDVGGDVMALLAIRDVLVPGTPARQVLRLLAQVALLAPTVANRGAIRNHYSFGDDFYLTFLDSRYNFYSQCLFASEEQTLEQAAENKLESMREALQLRPGMRVLDIGGGWGGLSEYCARLGVHVTSLTLTDSSAMYIRNRLERQGLTADVLVEDVLEHRPEEPYDHAVIFGVIEHIPTYRRFCSRLWEALKPGGRLYLDASATKEKYALSPFTRAYTWHGPHSCLALQDLTRELLFHGFEVVRVRRETRDYELTMRRWAERLEEAEDRLVAEGREPLYRAFRVFLWGGAHAFRTNRLQAYSVVAERRVDPGPRPGPVRRLGHGLLSLR